MSETATVVLESGVGDTLGKVSLTITFITSAKNKVPMSETTTVVIPGGVAQCPGTCSIYLSPVTKQRMTDNIFSRMVTLQRSLCQATLLAVLGGTLRPSPGQSAAVRSGAMAADHTAPYGKPPPEPARQFFPSLEGNNPLGGGTSGGTMEGNRGCHMGRPP